MPKVSVCMPCYNHEHYVAAAVQSVLDQTYKDFELIITDDGSTDHSREIIQQFTDPRIKAFLREQNKGAAATVADCVRESSGEYIAILNSDDEFRPAKLAKQVAFLDEHPQVAAVFTHTWFINRWGKDYNPLNIGFYQNKHNIFNQPNRTRWEWLHTFFYRGNLLCHPSILARREVYTTIAPPDNRFRLMGDFNRWVKLCLQHEIHIIPEILLNFRIHPKNASGDWLSPQPVISWEHLLVLRNFRMIDDPEHLRLIFPGIFREMALEPEFIPYYLALAAASCHPKTYCLFAVELLSDLLADPVRAQKLMEKHGFGYQQFQRWLRKL